MILVDEHIERYLEKMVRLVVDHPTLQGHPIETIEATCRVLAFGMRPIVEVLEETDCRFVFRIISPPLASYIGGCLGNDTNCHLHTGEHATTQSNALIGICTDAVMRSLGGRLITVDPLSFRNPLPHGEPVLVIIEVINRDRLTKGTIEVKSATTGKIIMKKANLTMSNQ